MKQALFENLTGHYLDGTPVEAVPATNRGIMSIMDHLNRLFNTREGSLPHLKDYGLPDISEIYRKMPHRHRGAAEGDQADRRKIRAAGSRK